MMKYSVLSRRGFLVVASGLVTTISDAMRPTQGLIALVETENESPVESVSDWITDKGDFYVVRVPAGKTFSIDLLDKSSVFYLENAATVTRTSVNGFVNVVFETNLGQVKECYFDPTKTVLASGNTREALILDWKQPIGPEGRNWGGGNYIKGNEDEIAQQISAYAQRWNTVLM